MGDIGVALEDGGLGNIAGLKDALSAVAPTVKALQALPEEELEAAISPLKLSKIARTKVQATLSSIRAQDGNSIHRGFDFEAEKIDKVSLTPRESPEPKAKPSPPPPPPPEPEEPPPPPPPPPIETEASEEAPPPPPPPPVETSPAEPMKLELTGALAPPLTSTPSTANITSVAVPSLSLQASPPANAATSSTSASAAFSDGPIFTPRTAAAQGAAADAGEAPEPVFTSRGGNPSGAGPANDEDDFPTFTPRTLAAAGEGADDEWALGSPLADDDPWALSSPLSSPLASESAAPPPPTTPAPPPSGPPPRAAGQNYDVGTRCYVKRSNGDTTGSWILKYDEEKKLYEVELEPRAAEGEKKNLKWVNEDVMKAGREEGQNYDVHADCYVKRSSGETALGWVINYDPEKKLYEVELYPRKPAGSTEKKNLKWVNETAMKPVEDASHHHNLADGEAAPIFTPRAVSAAPTKVAGQNYDVHSSCYVKRSNGEANLAWICAYDQEAKLYSVELEPRGSKNFKKVNEDMMRPDMARDPEQPIFTPRAVPPSKAAPVVLLGAPKPAAVPPRLDGQNFDIGTRCYVKRTNGDLHMAWILEYDGEKQYYSCELEPRGEGNFKKTLEKVMHGAQPVSPPPRLDGQNFDIGLRVFVKRSNGEANLAWIIKFDKEKKLYEVELEPRKATEDHNKNLKWVHEGLIRPDIERDDNVPIFTPRAAPGAGGAAPVKKLGMPLKVPDAPPAPPLEPGQTYAIGARVYVMRSNGEAALALVDRFDAATKMYIVECEPKGSKNFKKADDSILRPGPEVTREEGQPIFTPRAVPSGATAAPPKPLSLGKPLALSIPKPKPPRAAGQNYDVGTRCYVKRSNGDTTGSWILKYDEEKKLYEVELEPRAAEGEKKNLKWVNEDVMKAGREEGQNYDVHADCYVKRSSGETALGWVINYDPEKKLYEVELYPRKPAGSTEKKNLKWVNETAMKPVEDASHHHNLADGEDMPTFTPRNVAAHKAQGGLKLGMPKEAGFEAAEAAAAAKMKAAAEGGGGGEESAGDDSSRSPDGTKKKKKSPGVKAKATGSESQRSSAPSSRSSKSDGDGKKKPATKKLGSPGGSADAAPKKGKKGAKKGAKGEKASACKFELHVFDAEGAELNAMVTELTAKQMGGTLEKALIGPACQALQIQTSSIAKVVVDEADADLKAKIVTFSSDEKVHVNVHLAGDAVRPKRFIIHVLSHAHKEGEKPLYKMSVPIPESSSGGMFGALLGGSWMSKPLRKALIDPALESADVLHAKVKAIKLGGVTVEGTESCEKYLSKYLKEGEFDLLVTITLDKSSEPKPFTIDIVQRDGAMLSSFQTTLTSTLMAKPLMAGLITPALEHLNVILPPGTSDQMVIKVDGQEMDHRRLAHAETSQFVSPVVDGVKLVNGMPMPGDIATHVEVILPAGAYAGEMSAKFIVTFHQTSPDAKPIDKMGAEISGKWMTTALKTAVIDPALSGFTKQHRNLKVNTKHMSVQIDGHTIDVNAITSTYAKKGQDCVRLKIVLPPDAVEDTSPAFIVDVLAANGDLVASMDAKLNQKWLAKPLLKAIIEPVMQAENILEVGYSKVTVDDHEVAHPETGHTAEHASKQVAVAARVKVHLRPTDRPLKKAIDPTTANPNALSPCTFNVEITLNDEVISASSTRPTIKWMKGKTLLQALVQVGVPRPWPPLPPAAFSPQNAKPLCNAPETPAPSLPHPLSPRALVFSRTISCDLNSRR